MLILFSYLIRWNPWSLPFSARDCVVRSSFARDWYSRTSFSRVLDYTTYSSIFRKQLRWSRNINDKRESMPVNRLSEYPVMLSTMYSVKLAEAEGRDSDESDDSKIWPLTGLHSVTRQFFSASLQRQMQRRHVHKLIQFGSSIYKVYTIAGEKPGTWKRWYEWSPAAQRLQILTSRLRSEVGSWTVYPSRPFGHSRQRSDIFGIRPLRLPSILVPARRSRDNASGDEGSIVGVRSWVTDACAKKL